MSDNRTMRENVLQAAQQCVCADRNNSYGAPEDNFAVIAALWQTYIAARCVGPGAIVDLAREDVAAMMILFKVGRLCSGTYQWDSWVDIAGYAACGGECAELKGEAEHGTT